MSGLKKLLIASVVINVIAIGIIGGHAAKRGWQPAPPPHKMMHAVIGSLPGEKQKIARDAYKLAMRENRESMKEEAKARDAYFDVLRAKEFNEDALEAAGARLHALRGAMVSRMQDATKSIVKDLTYEERVELANALERMMEQRAPFGKRGPGAHDGPRPPHDGPRPPHAFDGDHKGPPRPRE